MFFGAKKEILGKKQMEELVIRRVPQVWVGSLSVVDNRAENMKWNGNEIQQLIKEIFRTKIL